MEKNRERFVEVPLEKWLDIRDMFKNNWPRNMTAYACLNEQFLNKSQGSEFPVKVYAPGGQPADGVLILVDMCPGTTEFSVLSLTDENPVLQRALLTTKMILWSNRNLAACVMLDYIHIVQDVVERLFPDLGCITDETFIAHLSREKALAYDVPEFPSDVVLEQVGESYAAEMDMHWPHRFDGSVNYFQNMLRWKRAYAILGKDDKMLRAWVLISSRGDLHAICTKPEYRRRGYGELLVKYMAKLLSGSNREIFGCIIIKNSASKSMFQKLGFEFVATTGWIVIDLIQALVDF